MPSSREEREHNISGTYSMVMTSTGMMESHTAQSTFLMTPNILEEYYAFWSGPGPGPSGPEVEERLRRRYIEREAERKLDDVLTMDETFLKKNRDKIMEKLREFGDDESMLTNGKKPRKLDV